MDVKTVDRNLLALQQPNPLFPPPIQINVILYSLSFISLILNFKNFTTDSLLF